ncbi:hypothetical protein HBI56_172510 [Parastagonospora nodorum]|nr:hypothetical protein HBH82_225310 [Parastagonospora nodorum]KAH4662895.1 hypothetical protein HBH78_215840 [Parastagonospora nodorum]KAH4692908.1 hypothetical protein HBH67_230780 [Parastagonospora nodorum]KAH4764762.1 hypothetical protein HBH63_184800 [Parastagonospora nodorum]KAH4769693.1 hypothetical protein HBH62_230170 [Parastagonospora nodorum]
MTTEMPPHTSWYPADDPADLLDHPPMSQQYHGHDQERMGDGSVSIPNMPFRLVSFTGGAPYPLHETYPVEQPHMIDLVSGDRFHRTESIRQPVAEDFLHPQRTFSAPPVKIVEADQHLDIIEPIEEHAEDQTLPMIEPDSYFRYFPDSSTHSTHSDMSRRDTIATTQPSKLLKVGPEPKRSESAENGRVVHNPAQAKIPNMGADEFDPAHGGLHKLPTIPLKKVSKISRIRRWLSGKDRRYGRASR